MEVVSKSLIARSPKSFVPNRRFCLGLPEWCPCCMDKSDDKPAKSLKLKRPRANCDHLAQASKKTKDSTESKSLENSKGDIDADRFDFDTTLEELDTFKEGSCPANAAKNTEWAVRTVEQWRAARNLKYSSDQCPANFLASDDRQEICNWLCKFITEVRKADGGQYTPRSIYLLLSGVQRHIRKMRPTEEINFSQDIVFRPLRNVCDAVYKRLHSKGIGVDTKATPLLSKNEEDILWERGILSLDNPTGLFNAVFFYNGKNFCLRGGAEHRKLRVSQLSRETNIIDGKEVSCYVYTEYGSKNNQGGLASLNQRNKTVKQYETDSERCHVKILDKYLEVLRRDTALENDAFYMQPNSEFSSGSSVPWFKKTPVGKNTLAVMIKKMCERAGISGGYINHSLRAFGTTTLFHANVPEKLIQQRTGHRSLEALRQYERTSESQLLDISNVMTHGGKLPSTNVKKDASSANKPSIKLGVPQLPVPKNDSVTLLLSNCTFTGCSVTLSGQAMNQAPQKTIDEQKIFEETLTDINIDDVFDD